MNGYFPYAPRNLRQIKNGFLLFKKDREIVCINVDYNKETFIYEWNIYERTIQCQHFITITDFIDFVFHITFMIILKY